MKEWIFKAIYYPLGGIILICCFGVLCALVKDVGWNQPFRWLCMIAILAFIADRMVNP